MADTITVTEWLEALDEIESDPGEGMTVGELSEVWGLAPRATRDRIRVAIKHGWVRVTRVKRQSIDGAMRTVPGYVLLRPE